MKKYILLTDKVWNNHLFDSLCKRKNEVWIRIDSEKEFSKKNLDIIKPYRIFIPHWSYIVPSQIFNDYECIVFHMTDLPFGRGGSPLQNLISRGLESTKISAIKIDQGIDTGDVYLKRELSLLGTAEEIFIRSSTVIESMIVEMLSKKIVPKPQSGTVVTFNRRKPHMSSIKGLKSIEDIYNHIRMLDAEGYPKAFLENEHYRIEFSRASLKANNSLLADVKIMKKDDK